MALLEKQLVVKKSTLPGAGMGLFTKRIIPKGTRIVEYKGRISSWKDVDHQDGGNAYIFYVNRNHVINAHPYKKAIARFANDGRGPDNEKRIANNCVYETDGKRVYITSTRDIPAGSEILVEYGKEYWDIIKTNTKTKTARKKKK